MHTRIVVRMVLTKEDAQIRRGLWSRGCAIRAVNSLIVPSYRRSKLHPLTAMLPTRAVVLFAQKTNARRIYAQCSQLRSNALWVRLLAVVPLPHGWLTSSSAMSAAKFTRAVLNNGTRIASLLFWISPLPLLLQ